MNSFVVFILDNKQFAIRLDIVQRIARVVEIMTLPKAPEIVIGVINVQGQVIPVIDLRRRFNLPLKDIELEDHLIIANMRERTLAILVDTVVDIIESNEKGITKQGEILPDIKYIEGVVKHEDGMLLIQDLEKVISLKEEKVLDKAIKDAKKGKQIKTESKEAKTVNKAKKKQITSKVKK
jgi:purine-binding chemotaxis protein CheW